MKSNQRRFNFVDLLLTVTAIIIISIFFTVFFKNSSQIDFTEKESVTVTLRVKDIPAKHSGIIKNADIICFSSDDEQLGSVKYINYDEETVEFLDKLTNTSAIYRAPDKRTALLLVDAMAENAGDMYTIAGKTLSKGDIIELYTPAFSFSATVVNVENDKE